MSNLILCRSVFSVPLSDNLLGLRYVCFFYLEWVSILGCFLGFVVKFKFALHSLHEQSNIVVQAVNVYVFGLGIKVSPFLSISFCVSLRVCFVTGVINFVLHLRS